MLLLCSYAIILSVQPSNYNIPATSIVVFVIPLAILSTGDVRSFAICMIFGVVVGTYSSNFLATNILYSLGHLEVFDILKEDEEEDLSDAALARSMLEEDTKKPRRKKDGGDPKILV